ncbi:MAG TPA: glycoside hydrolase family 3 protein, partial [Cellvibrio sp.]
MSFLIGCDSKTTETTATTTPTPTATTAPAKVEWPAITSAVKKDPAVETRIDELLAKMTLEEKIGQLIQPEIKFLTPEDIKQYHVGSVLNGGGSTPGSNKYATMEDWVKLADSFYNASIDKS